MSDRRRIKYEEWDRNNSNVLQNIFPLTERENQGSGEKLAENDSFNTLTHDLVPEHHLLSPDEAEQVLQNLGIHRDQLPKIRRSDAAIQILASIHGDIPEGSIIKVVRKSKTAEVFTAYRLVVSEGKS
jgi:DNA-directed RNA polymerase subunit H